MLSRIAAAALLALLATPAVAGKRPANNDFGHHGEQQYKYGVDHKRHGGVWIGNGHHHGGSMHGGHFGAGHGHFSSRGQGGHHWGW